MARLDVKAVALGAGISWGLLVLSVGWTSMFGWGARVVDAISSLYIGYAPSFPGGLIGGLWGFADGAIGGAIFALVYNRVAKR